MQILLQEVRYAIRQLINSPWFTVTVIFTLALGIGANSAIFSVMNAVLLKGLPVPNPQELVYLHVPSGQPEAQEIRATPRLHFLSRFLRTFAKTIMLLPT